MRKFAPFVTRLYCYYRYQGTEEKDTLYTSGRDDSPNEVLLDPAAIVRIRMLLCRLPRTLCDSKSAFTIEFYQKLIRNMNIV